LILQPFKRILSCKAKKDLMFRSEWSAKRGFFSGGVMKRQVSAIAMMALAGMFFFAFQTVKAQQATTSLRGTVTDPGGNLVAGASVTITRADTGQVLTTTTNASGEYQFQQLAPGGWTVKVSATGFSDQRKTGDLLVSKPATIDFQMTVQPVSQTVNVSGEKICFPGWQPTE
jgi:hypothetical protein